MCASTDVAETSRQKLSACRDSPRLGTCSLRHHNAILGDVYAEPEHCFELVDEVRQLPRFVALQKDVDIDVGCGECTLGGRTPENHVDALLYLAGETECRPRA